MCRRGQLDRWTRCSNLQANNSFVLLGRRLGAPGMARGLCSDKRDSASLPLCRLPSLRVQCVARAAFLGLDSASGTGRHLALLHWPRRSAACTAGTSPRPAPRTARDTLQSRQTAGRAAPAARCPRDAVTPSDGDPSTITREARARCCCCDYTREY